MKKIILTMMLISLAFYCEHEKPNYKPFKIYTQ
jgi:hypothetical protein